MPDKEKPVLKTGKPHISFSELKDHIECSFRHKLKYIDKIDLFEENVYTNFGTAIHASCEDYILTRDMKYDIALDLVAQLWEKHDLPDVGLYLQRVNKILDEVPNFLDQRFPGWRCVAAEEDLYEKLSDEHPDVFFKGFIDAIIEHEDSIYLLDWKTSEEGWNKWKRNDSKLKMQLILYKHYWTTKHNIPYDKVKCGFVILNRKLDAIERIDYYSFPIDEKKRKISLDILNESVSLIKKGAAFKPMKHGNPQMQGVCRFCEYNNTKWCP